MAQRPGALWNVLRWFGYTRHTMDLETTAAVFAACPSSEAAL